MSFYPAPQVMQWFSNWAEPKKLLSSLVLRHYNELYFVKFFPKVSQSQQKTATSSLFMIDENCGVGA